MKIMFTAAFCFALLLQPAGARAQPQGLSEDAIRFFYQQEVDSYKWPYQRFNAFLQASMTDNFISDNTVTVTIPNQPPKVTPNTQSKASIAASGQGEYNMMQHANVTLNISAIRIATDGKSAAVDYQTTARNMTVSASGSQQMSADSQSACTDTLVPSDSGTIQIKNTRCTTAINVVTAIVGGLNQPSPRRR